MIRSNLLIVLTACAVAGASGLAGCAGAASDTAGSAAPVEQGSSSASTKDGAKDDAASTPLTAADLRDGDYDITVTSSSRMFNVKKAVLHVADGSMTCTMTLGGTGYGKLFMGTGDEAASAAENSSSPSWKTQKAPTSTRSRCRRSTKRPTAPLGASARNPGTTEPWSSNPRTFPPPPIRHSLTRRAVCTASHPARPFLSFRLYNRHR